MDKDRIAVRDRPFVRYAPSLIMVAGLALYLTTLSVRLDRNSVYELVAIESGSAQVMFLPRHMLFAPLGAGFYKLWQLMGYSGNSLRPTQLIVATSAAVSLALLFRVLRRVSNDWRTAMLLTCAYATSYAFWYWSTNVHYILPTLVCVLASFLLACDAAGQNLSALRLVAVGLFVSFAVAFWQANICLLLPLSYTLQSHYSDRREGWRITFLWALLTGLGIAGFYILVALLVHRIDSLPALWSWLTTYGGQMTIFGRLDATRVISATHSALSAIVPVWQGLGLRALLAGHVSPDKVIPQLSLVATVVVAITAVISLVRYRHDFTHTQRRFLIIGSVWVTSYLAFILWWDPFEPRWWLMPMIGMWLILAVVLDRARLRAPRVTILLPALWAATLLLANFQSTIYPRRFEPDPAMAKAQAAREFVGSQDLLVDLFWEDWTTYIWYLDHSDVFFLPHEAAYYGREESLRKLRNRIQAYLLSGHHVFIPNWSSYPETKWQWPLGLLGINKSDLDSFTTQYAWNTGDEIVWQIIDVQVRDVH